jgi:iron complex outermembrane receptor protein
MRSMLLPSLTVVAVALPAVPALAQETGLEEIVVTATRREESLQDVAASATVFSARDLQTLRVLQPRDLAEQTPGLLAKYGPNGLATVGFYMRGVGINDFTGTVDPSVGVYVDEVFQPTPDMLNFAVYDIERVEVLRGPQGTLYGRNSTGGAINFITARPTREVEGYVCAGYGSYETATASAALSGPLSDTLLGRLSVNVVNAPDDSGYSYNRFTDNLLGKNESLAARVQLEWQPSEAFSARLMYNYGDAESEQALLQHVGVRDPANPANTCASVIAGKVNEGPCRDLLGYFDDDGEFYDGAANVDPQLEMRSDDFTLTLDWDVGRASLTSISAYADFSKEQSQDIDASPFVAADNFTFNDVENWSQEVRLTSDDSFSLPWIVGVNYAKTEIDWFQTINLSQLAGIPTSNGAEQSTEAWAAFGQLTVPLGDLFEFTGGLRFTSEERDWRGATFVGEFASLDEAYASGAPRLSELPIPDGDPRQGGPLDFPSSLDEDKVDYHATLKYKPSDTAMYYLTVSEAFRSGGFSSAVIFSQEQLEPYGPETLTSIEAGLKLSSADNRVRFNASAYYYIYDDFQATFVRGTEASARLQNAGDVRIQGIDASLDWAPVQGLSIGAGVNLLDSEIVDTDVVLPPLDGSPPSTIEGNEIPNAPSFTFSGRLRYETPVSDTLAAAFQTDFSHVDEHYLEPNNREFLSEDGYTLVNARLSLMPQDGPWQVSAWVKNVSDEKYRTAAQDISLALGFSEIVTGLPRTWGVELEYRF